MLFLVEGGPRGNSVATAKIICKISFVLVVENFEYVIEYLCWNRRWWTEMKKWNMKSK